MVLRSDTFCLLLKWDVNGWPLTFSLVVIIHTMTFNRLVADNAAILGVSLTWWHPAFLQVMARCHTRLPIKGSSEHVTSRSKSALLGSSLCPPRSCSDRPSASPFSSPPYVGKLEFYSSPFSPVGLPGIMFYPTSDTNVASTPKAAKQLSPTGQLNVTMQLCRSQYCC